MSTNASLDQQLPWLQAVVVAEDFMWKFLCPHFSSVRFSIKPLSNLAELASGGWVYDNPRPSVVVVDMGMTNLSETEALKESVRLSRSGMPVILFNYDPLKLNGAAEHVSAVGHMQIKSLLGALAGHRKARLRPVPVPFGSR